MTWLTLSISLASVAACISAAVVSRHTRIRWAAWALLAVGLLAVTLSRHATSATFVVFYPISLVALWLVAALFAHLADLWRRQNRS